MRQHHTLKKFSLYPYPLLTYAGTDLKTFWTQQTKSINSISFGVTFQGKQPQTSVIPIVLLHCIIMVLLTSEDNCFFKVHTQPCQLVTHTSRHVEGSISIANTCSMRTYKQAVHYFHVRTHAHTQTTHRGTYQLIRKRSRPSQILCDQVQQIQGPQKLLSLNIHIHTKIILTKTQSLHIHAFIK